MRYHFEQNDYLRLLCEWNVYLDLTLVVRHGQDHQLNENIEQRKPTQPRQVSQAPSAPPVMLRQKKDEGQRSQFEEGEADREGDEGYGSPVNAIIPHQVDQTEDFESLFRSLVNRYRQNVQPHCRNIQA